MNVKSIHSKRGYALVVFICIVAGITLAAFVSVVAVHARLEYALWRTQGRLEADVVARACVSRAMFRYQNGLRRFPKRFYIGQGTCTFVSAVEGDDAVTLVLRGESLGQHSMLEASISLTDLKLISFIFH